MTYLELLVIKTQILMCARVLKAMRQYVERERRHYAFTFEAPKAEVLIKVIFDID